MAQHSIQIRQITMYMMKDCLCMMSESYNKIYLLK
jgi:hypothetical protein